MKLTLQAINFPGFYESILSASNVEAGQFWDLRDAYSELEHLDEWGVTDDWEFIVANDYAHHYIKEISESLGVKMKVLRHDVDSPKYYNFRTDHLYIDVEVDESELKSAILSGIEKHKDELRKIIKRNHTSCDGFWSFMSNDVEEWSQTINESWTSELFDDEEYISYAAWYLYCAKEFLSYDEAEGGLMMAENVLDELLFEGYGGMMPKTESAIEEYEQWEDAQQRKITMRQLPSIPGLV